MLKEVQVKQFMTGKLIAFSPNTHVMKAIQTLLDHRISGAPVTDNHGNLIGLVSEKDCMKGAITAGYFGEGGSTVGDVMSANVESVQSEDSVWDVAERFLQTNYRRFPVLEDGELVGQISRRDVLRAINELSGTAKGKVRVI